MSTPLKKTNVSSSQSSSTNAKQVGMFKYFTKRADITPSSTSDGATSTLTDPTTTNNTTSDTLRGHIVTPTLNMEDDGVEIMSSSVYPPKVLLTTSLSLPPSGKPPRQVKRGATSMKLTAAVSMKRRMELSIAPHDLVIVTDRSSDSNSSSASVSCTMGFEGAYRDETPRDAGIERLISSNMRPSESPLVMATTTMELTADEAVRDIQYDRDAHIEDDDDDDEDEDHIMAVVDTTTTTITPTTTTTTTTIIPAPEVVVVVEAVKKSNKVAVTKNKRKVVTRVKHAAPLSSSIQLAQKPPSDLCGDQPTGLPDSSDLCTAAATTLASAATAPKATRRKRKAAVVPLNALDTAVSEAPPTAVCFPSTADATIDGAAASIPVETDSLPVSNTIPPPPPPPPTLVKKRVRRVSSKQKAALESESLMLDGDGDGDASTTIPAAAVASTTIHVAKKLKPCPASKASHQEKAVVAVYSHDVELKMKLHREKMQALVLELGQLESCDEFKDSKLDLLQAAKDLVEAKMDLLLPHDTAVSPHSDLISPVGSESNADDDMMMMTTTTTAVVSGSEVDSSATAIIAKDHDDDVVAPTPDSGLISTDDMVVAMSTATEAVEPSTPSTPLEDGAKKLISAFIARMIQGSSSTLQEIVQCVQCELNRIVAELRNSLEKKEPPPVTTTSILSELSSEALLYTESTTKQQLIASLESYSSSNVLIAQLISSLAERKSYGNRHERASMFEDRDPMSVNRWEAFSMQHFSKPSQHIIVEARALRNRYSRSLKAIQKVVDQLKKIPLRDDAVVMLEEKAAKSIAEIEKAKEKRREVEAKRASDQREKDRKAEAIRLKRLEKEEADRLRRQEMEEKKMKAAVKGVPVEDKKKIAFEKEATLMKSLFTKSSLSSSCNPASTSSGSSTGSMKMNKHTTQLHADGVSAVGVGSDRANKLDADTEGSLVNDKLAMFESALNSNMAVEEIQAYYRKKYSSSKRKQHSTASKYISLHVAVTVTDNRVANNRSSFDQSDNTYTEMQERWFHHKMRTLSFHTDTRPAYVGTISKKSRVITGRRPFAKDVELLNYEYDSEEDWEEEVEGEDLNDTDEEEEEGGGNELVYDDFFCRDDDYGSDGDGDEGVVRVTHRSSVEVLGPRFIQYSAAVEDGLSQNEYIRSRSFVVDAMSGGCHLLSMHMGGGKTGDDAELLSSFGAVFFAIPSAALPRLGVVVGGDSHEKAVCKDKEAIPKPSSEKSGDKKPSSQLTSALAIELIRFIHGKKDGSDKLTVSFQELHPMLSKAQIHKQIRDLAVKTKDVAGNGSLRWVVRPDVLELHGLKEGVDVDKVEFSPLRKKSKGHRITPTLLTMDPVHVGGGPVNPVKNLLSSFTRMAEGREDVDSSAITTIGAATAAATTTTTTTAVTTATTGAAATAATAAATTTGAAVVPSDRECDSKELERGSKDSSPAVLQDQGIDNSHQVNADVTASQVDSTSNKGTSNGIINVFSTMKSPAQQSSSALKPKAKATSSKPTASKSHQKSSKPVSTHHHPPPPPPPPPASSSSIQRPQPRPTITMDLVPTAVLLPSDGMEDRVNSTHTSSIQDSAGSARPIPSSAAATTTARSTPSAKTMTSFLIAATTAATAEKKKKSGGSGSDRDGVSSSSSSDAVVAPSIIAAADGERDVVVIDD